MRIKKRQNKREHHTSNWFASLSTMREMVSFFASSISVRAYFAASVEACAMSSLTLPEMLLVSKSTNHSMSMWNVEKAVKLAYECGSCSLAWRCGALPELIERTALGCFMRPFMRFFYLAFEKFNA